MFNLACLVLVGSLLMLAGGNGSSSSDYSSENIRDKLRKSEFDNHEVQEISRKLRTDSDFRFQHEKNIRRGMRYEDSIRELLETDER